MTICHLDYDPELDGNDQSDSDSDASEDANAGTEHYVSVGKSKLRQKENVSLGPEYRGSKVSRQALEQDSDQESDEEEDENDDDEAYDDPDNFDLEADTAEANDSEIDSDGAFAESDEEKFEGFSFGGKKQPGERAKASDFMSGSESEEEELEEMDDETDEDEEMNDGLDDLINGAAGSDEDEEDMDDEDEDEEQEDGSEDEGDEGESEEDDSEDDETEAKSAKAAQDTSSNNADVAKGVAIQQQRKAYDGLLNLRIRLQKALIAANTFPTIENASSTASSEPYEAAEEAAIKLLNTIGSLRSNLTPSTASRTGEKRKRDLEVSTPTSKIWAQLQQENDSALKFRHNTLEKWSRKVQSVNVQAPRGGLAANSKTLVSSLQEQLNQPFSRLIKRTRVPRSCAPAQAAEKKPLEDDDLSASTIYDDADFYQLLLKELVDQRTVETSSSATAALSVPSVMLTASKEAKMRKNVDRKASKGRKMRFTVHEKLQNFMAPEDRRSWEQGAIDRFLGTLFGRRLELNEEDSVDEDEGSDSDLDGEGLRLF